MKVPRHPHKPGPVQLGPRIGDRREQKDPRRHRPLGESEVFGKVPEGRGQRKVRPVRPAGGRGRGADRGQSGAGAAEGEGAPWGEAVPVINI